MERQIATTAEQSARLLQCGVPAESADMSWFRAWGNVGDFNLNVKPYSMMVRINEESCRGRNEITPAFSLSALLGLFPKEMGIAVGAYPGSDKYTCFTLIDPDVEPIVADTAIEACVIMVEQLYANGYALNGIEKGGSEHGEY